MPGKSSPSGKTYPKTAPVVQKLDVNTGRRVGTPSPMGGVRHSDVVVTDNSGRVLEIRKSK